MSRFRFYHLFLAAVIAGVATASANAAIITQWNFENQPVTGAFPLTNNSPTPSTGAGTADAIGMNIYPTTTVGQTSCDILDGVSGDTGTNGVSNLTQIWRVRAQNAAGTANGWSSMAPIGTQGAQFAVSTAGYSNVTVNFDWYATNQGEANMQLEYSNDGGVTWINQALTNPLGAGNLTLRTNLTDPNLVIGSYVNGGTAGQQWFPDLTATINDPLAANNPNFEIEMVNAATGVDCLSVKGTALNNSSGNWRFDNVTVSGTAIVPEPSTICLAGMALVGLAVGVRRKK
jgi:hypothetical protein